MGIINGCVFNGKLENACKFLFDSFAANIKLCGDVYNNILKNLLTNRIMEFNHKNEISLKVCNEIKSRGLEVDYELYSKIMKMVYRNSGKNQYDNKIQRNMNSTQNNNNSYNNYNNNEDNQNYGYENQNSGYKKNNSYKNKFQKY